MSPNVYIIAGPNGAGKTTFAREFLPNYADCKNFINADLIALGVSPFAAEEVAFRAGRLMIGEIELYAKRGESFAFETTLSGRSHLSTIRHLRKRGYKVRFFFLWIPTVHLALTRVRARTKAITTGVAPELSNNIQESPRERSRSKKLRIERSNRRRMTLRRELVPV